MLAEQLPLVVYVSSMDVGEPPVYVSRRIEQLTGYTPQEWRNSREFSRFVHEADRERVQAEELARRQAEEDSFVLRVQARPARRSGGGREAHHLPPRHARHLHVGTHARPEGFERQASGPFLQKPFPPALLARTIRQVLSEDE
jgi:PAS domain-containing protein